MKLKHTPTVKTTVPFNYFYGGLNTLAIIKGKFIQGKNYQGNIITNKVVVNSYQKTPVENDLISQIINCSSNDLKSKIICTLPLKIQRDLMTKFPESFLYGLAEDESNWYIKESIISFRQTLSSYELPANILNSVPQYLRTEGDEIKSLVSFVKTVNSYFRKQNYWQYLQTQLGKIS